MSQEPEQLAQLRDLIAQTESSGVVPDKARAGRTREAPVTQIQEDDEQVRGAAAFILRSTNNRPQSESEVRTKLATREYPSSVIDSACAHAREVGALDD